MIVKVFITVAAQHASVRKDARHSKVLGGRSQNLSCPSIPTPATQPLGARWYSFSCWILGRSWDGRTGTRNHSAYILLGMELFQCLNNHCDHTAECEPWTVHYTLDFEYMDRKPSSKIILLIAEFMKTLKQLYKHFTKTQKSKNASGKVISLKVRLT